jgi:hypothetical protein
MLESEGLPVEGGTLPLLQQRAARKRQEEAEAKYDQRQGCVGPDWSGWMWLSDHHVPFV